MKHRERVLMALHHEQPDRCPMQISFTPEFASRLKGELGLTEADLHNPHGGGNTYVLERTLGEDMILTSVGWANSYYATETLSEDGVTYTDEWGVTWRNVEYETRFGTGRYTEMVGHPLADEQALDTYRPPDPHRPELYVEAERVVREFKDEYWIVGALYRARFKSPVPRVWFREDTLTIQDQHSPLLDQPVNSHQPFAEIRLNGSIPWEIEFRNGVSGLMADLGRLQLRSLDVLGGASRIELVLSKPTGTAFIYISRGFNQGTIRRPTGVGMRIQVSGGVRELVFDDQHLGAVGGETSLETPDYLGATCRYDICIAGGASYVTIEEDP